MSKYWPDDGRPQTTRWLNILQQGQADQLDEPGAAAFAPAGGVLPAVRPITVRRLRNSQPDIRVPLPDMPRPALRLQKMADQKNLGSLRDSQEHENCQSLAKGK